MKTQGEDGIGMPGCEARSRLPWPSEGAGHCPHLDFALLASRIEIINFCV